MNEQRTYEDYEGLARYLKTAEEAVHLAQRKVFDMFGGLDPLVGPGETVTPETRPGPTIYDEYILEVVLRLQRLRSELIANFQAEIPESEVPLGKPRTPPAFYLMDDENA
jgi:hypothetical protein